MKAKKKGNQTFIDVLEKDHRLVEDIFKKIEKAKTGARKLSHLEHLWKEFRVHAEAEEHILYPRMKEIKDLRETSFEAFEEHEVAKQLFQELLSGDAGTEEWKAKCTVLKEVIEHHVEEEEEEIFPKLKKQWKKEELVLIGEQIKEFKQEGPGEEEVPARRREKSPDMIQQPGF